MKNYLIETTANGYFVHVGDEPFGGPYKNEESAKRRIRDLKRKENEQREIVADMQATGMIISAKSSPAVFKQDDMTNQMPFKKLAVLLEYGKFKLDPVAFAKAVNTDHPIVRQVGCYPAISKHAYQR